MCGIAGFVDGSRGRSRSELDRLARAMTDQMIHRGPDDDGTIVDEDGGIALGFRRLAIIDLTPAGHQPMESACGRWVIVFNGEIYNAEDMRLGLTGVNFRGHSDTEVLIESIARIGVEAALDKAIGMFAFAAYDRRTRTTWFARDRLGKKPLYLGQFGRTLMFASELRCFRVHPDFRAELDPEAIAAYTRFGYVPHPLSIYRSVRQLDPGSWARLDASGVLQTGFYWRVEDVAAKQMQGGVAGPDEVAIEDLERLLADSVKRRMVSDVPLGAFLSGGIDSSLVVAFMQAQSAEPVHTFSIGFNVEGYDEAPHARAVAAHLGTKHREFYVSPEEALAVVPKLPDIYDEPFADSSQIPTYIVSKLARQHVTVALSGDGGDESFAGYGRYAQVREWSQTIASTPALAGPLASAGIALLQSRVVAPMRRSLPGRVLARGESYLARMRDAANRQVFEHTYMGMASQGRPPAEFLARPRERLAPVWDGSLAGRYPDPVQRAQMIDFMTYLPDDILTKVDRASMAVSLEVRAPLLDHRVVEFAWRLPHRLKMRGADAKWALRQILYKYVPRDIIDRPKMGFGIPIDHWLRGPLRDWAEALIDERRLEQEGVFAAKAVRAMWARHLSGETWQYPIWCVLMFQAWRERWG
ncbi:MAG: asparagine synthase (glutamine-hydrolyzing) [Pseudomonadota bacterium]